MSDDEARRFARRARPLHRGPRRSGAPPPRAWARRCSTWAPRPGGWPSRSRATGTRSGPSTARPRCSPSCGAAPRPRRRRWPARLHTGVGDLQAFALGPAFRAGAGGDEHPPGADRARATARPACARARPPGRRAASSSSTSPCRTWTRSSTPWAWSAPAGATRPPTARCSSTRPGTTAGTRATQTLEFTIRIVERAATAAAGRGPAPPPRPPVHARRAGRADRRGRDGADRRDRATSPARRWTATPSARSTAAGSPRERPRPAPRPPLSGRDEHLRRPRQHRRPGAAPARGAGIGLEVTRAGRRATRSSPGDHDLFYLGGGQDRDQAVVAEDLAATKGEAPARRRRRGGRRAGACAAASSWPGTATPATDGSRMPGVGILDLDTVAGPTRLIGNLVDRGRARTARAAPCVGFENHAGRTRLGPGSRPLGRVAQRPRQQRRGRLGGRGQRPRDRHLPARAAAAQEPLDRRHPDPLGPDPPHRASPRRWSPLDDSLEDTGARRRDRPGPAALGPRSATPVEPKPPSPRPSEGGSSSTSTAAARLTGVSTSWAMRSPGRTRVALLAEVDHQHGQLAAVAGVDQAGRVGQGRRRGGAPGPSAAARGPA